MDRRTALLLVAALSIAPLASAAAQDTYKIGASLGLTGYSSNTDSHWRDGLTLAIDDINAKGGVLGHKLALVVEDNKSTPQQAVIDYRKMLSQDQVKAFDSGCVSAGNFAGAPFAAKAKTPMFLCSILPRGAEEQKWAFSFLPPPAFEVEARYAYLKDHTQVRKIGILADPSPYSMMMQGLAEKEAEKYGLQVVAKEAYQQEDADFSVQLGHINAAGAGAVIMIGQGNAVVTVANNIKHLGLNNLLLLGSINEAELLRAAGGVLGDRYLFPSPMIQVAVDDLDAIKDPASRAAAEAFVRALKAKYPNLDTAMASRAWDSIHMLAHAIESAKSVDGTAVRDAFEKIGHYDGAGASYDFSNTQHVGITKNPYVIAYVQNGKLAIAK